MFCSNCGKEVNTEGSYCSYCGKPVAAPAENTAPVNREEELAKLDRLIQYFMPKSAAYGAYEAACEKIKKYSKGSSNALIIWGAIVLSVGLMILIAEAGELDFRDSLIASGVLFLLPGLLMLGGGILHKVLCSKKRRESLSNYEKLSNELYNHFLGCPNPEVGPEYTNPVILIKLFNIIRGGRADNLKEAFNILYISANQQAINNHVSRVRRSVSEAKLFDASPVIFLPSQYFN